MSGPYYCYICEEAYEGDDEQWFGAQGFRRRVCVPCFFKFIETNPPTTGKAGPGTGPKAT